MTFTEDTKRNLRSQAQFGPLAGYAPGKVGFMPIEAGQVAARIMHARGDKELLNSAQLAAALRRRTGTKKPTDETVRLWEKGAHVPPYDMIELLSLELGRPGEWILFGIEPGTLQHDRYVLEHVTEEELRLLNYLRHTAKEHRGDTLEHAQVTAKRHPAPMAQIKKFPGKRGVE